MANNANFNRNSLRGAFSVQRGAVSEQLHPLTNNTEKSFLALKKTAGVITYGHIAFRLMHQSPFRLGI